MFGKSLEDSVKAALDTLRNQFPQANLSATTSGKVVTLAGEAPDLPTKTRIMEAFNAMVETENTVNRIALRARPAAPAAPAPAPAAEPAERVHVVVRGDTLSALAKQYYGSAGKYMKIFEANRDILDDPDKIKVGQKLRIPG